MKNSREQWKYDFHRPAVMGDLEGKSILHHDVIKDSDEKSRYNDMKTAGVSTFEPNRTKGFVVKGEMAARKEACQAQSSPKRF